MTRTLVAFSAFLALCAATPAFADDPTPTAGVTATPEGTQSVTLPTGKVVEAKKFVNPAEGSIEHAILASMKQIKAGDFDGWIRDWCHPSTCPDAAANEAFKAYQLTASSKSVGQCMSDDGGFLETKSEVDPDGSTRVYAFCTSSRMPAPASAIHTDSGWKLTSFSW